ncbi:FHA domain-containing protein [Euhalothece natronophila Z-M001]|uniref:FHA domain-containing protein n=1 Tax=Euhalothece natronophila Z-M001 TaxID=522448 RepID=A0A5B8NMA3_9CHRO|nr:FHA domain-containing protein [Euhalothece natronophila]QDZ39415.1 FHA domain-containing protein [Euhalothece natronophila Z-M001]
MNENYPEVPDNGNLDPEPTVVNSSETPTNLQQTTPYLVHIQTGKTIELPEQEGAEITLGKPNSNHPPDIDLSDFPDAAIISRQHANIHIEAETYYIKDLDSSNGTYVNNNPVPTGEAQELSAGDIIALGKEDKVTFIFKIP